VAPRSCVRTVVLAAMMSALVSAMLPGCGFPDYGMASGGGASGAFASGGSSGGDRAGGSGESGDPGSEAGAGAGGEGGMNVEPPPTPCAQTCLPHPPGWIGPMAFSETQSPASLPGCPAGFDEATPTDLHHELVAPDGTCACMCLPAEGQVCDTVLHISADQACGPQCAQVGTRGCTSVPASCTGIQGTTSIDAMMISGGSCKSKVDPPVDATWKYNDRLCRGSDVGACDGPDQFCARVPDLPYLSSVCVTRQIQNGEPVPKCPDAYSHQVGTLYGDYTDDRACSPCICGAPTGGTCTGKIAIYGGVDCDNTTDDAYVLSTMSNPTPSCQPFNLNGSGLRPTHVLGQYVLSPPGNCGVTTKSEPIRDAKPSGMVTVVCCQ